MKKLTFTQLPTSTAMSSFLQSTNSIMALYYKVRILKESLTIYTGAEWEDNQESD